MAQVAGGGGGAKKPRKMSGGLVGDAKMPTGKLKVTKSKPVTKGGVKTQTVTYKRS